MSIEVPRWLVEFILLGPEEDRRQLQDSPILGDVWMEFAKPLIENGKKSGDQPLELLITPYRDNAAANVATALVDCGLRNSNIAYLQGIVAARLTFEQLLRYVVPMTSWWCEPRIQEAVAGYKKAPTTIVNDIEEILNAAYAWRRKERRIQTQPIETRKRYIALAGLILWAKGSDRMKALSDEAQEGELRDIADAITKLLTKVLRELREPETGKKGLIWTVAMNRKASPALIKSVPSVKADAVKTLFSVDCSEIVWAVIDSGVDATHVALKDNKGEMRVRKSFDFSSIREIISLDNADAATRKQHVSELLKLPLQNKPTAKDASAYLKRLAEDARQGRSIAWEMVEQLIEIDPATPPQSNHGTHVAGILGAKKMPPAAPMPAPASKRAAKKPAIAAAPAPISPDAADGMCPDIGIYDFRVLGSTLEETEFAIIAALQYIRYMNERNSWFTVHGANLSLSIPHNVRNYACGRTPVCHECERLVDSGVVVVAAAGNRGYHNFETKEGLYEGYAAFSVTDPGNAEGVITVGATHRYWPHTYGVSFFSSRGPTGDGRLKPDLVAPGERIRAPLPGNQWGDLDGTSMAAPHVSGAAAMLMARYSELIGNPRRIKQILCQSATDLGREKTFQGHGMLDVLRAFQSI